jgi:hypothetical protein
MPDLDEVIDRLREIAGRLREASEDGGWYKQQGCTED